MSYQVLASGFVSARRPSTPTSVTAGPRCALRPDGSILCTFLAQAALGLNDFKPMLCRSTDGGLTWSEPRLLFPALAERYSIFGSISGAPNGDCYFYGMRTPIDQPGEAAWSPATQGLKQNDLVWSRSADGGATWSPFAVIPKPTLGSVEAPGALCVTRGGELIGCYAPYPTFDPAVSVQKNQVVAVRSRDQGRTWTAQPMLRFPQPDANGAEAWVIELADGRLLGAGWHIHGETPQPNPYALSRDGGASWSATRSTGILGQSTALAALPDGRALFVYNQRQQRDPGVWLAVVRPTEQDFGVEANARVWTATQTVQAGGSEEHKDWTSFAFGEPAVTVLPDGSVLLVLWCIQPDGQGIRYVKLRL